MDFRRLDPTTRFFARETVKFCFDLERSKTGQLLFFISNGLAPKKITDSILVRYNLLSSRTWRTLSILDENMSMFAGQNGGPYSGSVTNPMMNPMMNNYSQNISAWMAPKQYGILATGVGSARDNILPGNVTKINRGKSSTRNRLVAVTGSLVTAKLKCIQTNTNSYWGRNDMRWKSVWNLPWENKQKRNKKCKGRF